MKFQYLFWTITIVCVLLLVLIPASGSQAPEESNRCPLCKDSKTAVFREGDFLVYFVKDGRRVLVHHYHMDEAKRKALIELADKYKIDRKK